MRRNLLSVENLEQRTVLSASAVLAAEVAMADNVESITKTDVVETPAAEVVANGGDFNLDGIVNAEDIDLLCAETHLSTPDMTFDLNTDEAVDKQDMDMLVRDIIGTQYGDLDLDGDVNGSDVGFMFQNIFTESPKWSSGDWTCDGVVDGQDFVMWNEYKFTETKLNSGGSVDEFRAPEVATEMGVATDSVANTAMNEAVPRVASAVVETMPAEGPTVRAPESPVLRESATEDASVGEESDNVQPAFAIAPARSARIFSSNSARVRVSAVTEEMTDSDATVAEAEPSVLETQPVSDSVTAVDKGDQLGQRSKASAYEAPESRLFATIRFAS